MDTDYLTPYDLLGLFLSLSGPAPQGATNRNFFLPMTHLYAQWCKKIASVKATEGAHFQGVAPPPTMYQCTWLLHSKNNDPPEYFLGASLSGYSTKRPKRNTNATIARRAVGLRWEQMIQECRYQLLPPDKLGPEYGTSAESPMRKDSPKIGTRFGNCAETHPFISLFGYAHSS
jgi:hypothetical protein